MVTTCENLKLRHIALKQRKHRKEICNTIKEKQQIETQRKEPMEAQRYQKIKDKMTIGNYNIIHQELTLNVNGLNSPTKRHRAANWIKNKTQPYDALMKHS